MDDNQPPSTPVRRCANPECNVPIGAGDAVAGGGICPPCRRRARRRRR